MTTSPKSRRPRASLAPSIASKRPKIAEKLWLSARSKIEKGIARVQEIKTPSQAHAAVSDGFPTSVTGFIKWVGIGRDRLYNTHSDLLSAVEGCVDSVRELSSAHAKNKKKKDPSAPDHEEENIRVMQEKIRELEGIIEILSIDVLSLGRDYDELRNNYAHAVSKYEEAVGSKLPRRVGVGTSQAAEFSSTDRDAVLVDIGSHREMRRRDRDKRQNSREG